jgi:predicted PurR-regulated permease PerM
VAFVLLGVLATLWVVMRLRTLIFIVFLSVFVAIALEPAAQFLAKRGWPRRLATGVVFLAAVLLGVGFVAALVPLFVSQAADLVDNLPGYLENVQSFLVDRGILNVDLVNSQITGQFQNLGNLLASYGTSVAGGLFVVGNTVFGLLFQVVTVALFSYYMVAEAPRFRRTVLSFLPPERQREAMRIWEIAVDKTGGYVYSRLLLAAVAAVFTASVLTILGVPYPVALGMWVGILSQFVPVIGTYIAAVLPVLVALFQHPITALWVLVALVAYQQVENFVVAPRITSRTMAIHPAVSVGAVIAGASLMGGMGAVLALPVAATVQAVISTALRRHEVVEEVARLDGPDPRTRRQGGDE